MRIIAALVFIALLPCGTQLLHAQGSVCEAWEGLVAARNSGFAHIVGSQIRQEENETVFQSTIRLGESWDGVYINRATRGDIRRFEAIKAGFMARWAADTFLNREVRKLQACLNGYTFLKDPALLVNGTTYYITDAAGLTSRRAIATLGYRHLKYDVYEAVFSMRSKDQMEIIPREAIPALSFPVKVSHGSSSINGEEFSRKLRQILGASKSNFSSIKGAPVSPATLPTNKSMVELPGAERSVIVNGGVAMLFIAYYPARPADAAAARMAELKRLIAESGLTGFAESGPEQKNGSSILTFRNETTSQTMELIKYPDGSTGNYKVRLQVKQSAW